MFVSLLAVLEQVDALGHELPENSFNLREELVEYLLSNPSRCKIVLKKDNRIHVQAMKSPGVLPIEEVLFAACNVYNVRVMVHHGMRSPVIYQISGADYKHTIHLQCLAGIHFNPARSVNPKQEIEISSKCVNSSKFESDTSVYLQTECETDIR